jgi:hypothetical protein
MRTAESRLGRTVAFVPATAAFFEIGDGFDPVNVF